MLSDLLSDLLRTSQGGPEETEAGETKDDRLLCSERTVHEQRGRKLRIVSGLATPARLTFLLPDQPAMKVRLDQTGRNPQIVLDKQPVDHHQRAACKRCRLRPSATAGQFLTPVPTRLTSAANRKPPPIACRENYAIRYNVLGQTRGRVSAMCVSAKGTELCASAHSSWNAGRACAHDPSVKPDDLREKFKVDDLLSRRYL